MDCMKNGSFSPSYKHHVKNAIVAISVLAAVTVFYLQWNRPNDGIENTINIDIKRDYRSRSKNNAEFPGDYSLLRVNSSIPGFQSTVSEEKLNPTCADKIIKSDNDSAISSTTAKSLKDRNKEVSYHITVPSSAQTVSTSDQTFGFGTNTDSKVVPLSPVISTDEQDILSSTDTNSATTQIDFSSSLSKKSGSTVALPNQPFHNTDGIHATAMNSRRPLSKMERQLFAARATILNVSPLVNSSANDMHFHSPIYRNLSQFLKSYELMEKMFKVYVYKEGSEPLVHTGPVTGIYSSEGLFIRQMEANSQFRTRDPEQALAFFLPYSVANMVDELYVPGSKSMEPLSSFIKDYVNHVASNHAFWNRTHGADHFIVACHDWGPLSTLEHAELQQNAMKVVCNADATSYFGVGRDASLPEFYMHSEKLNPSPLGGPGPDARKSILAFFAGKMHGPLRPKLLEYWQYPRGGEEMQIHGVLPQVSSRTSSKHRTKTHVKNILSYDQYMRSSKFCLCPMGFEVNSPRIVEAIYADCVPVIIADGFVLPFSEVLDWSSFSLRVPEKDLPHLKSILMSVSDRRYNSLQQKLRFVRRHFLWHNPPKPFDTFHMILHSVWTTRLYNITSTSFGQ